jgi:hypothetical protein
MLSIFKFSVYDYAEDLNALLRLNSLSFNSKRLIVRLICLARKKDNCYLVCFESRTASLFLFYSATNNCFYAFPVALCYRPYNLGYKVVYERYSTSISINPLLN